MLIRYPKKTTVQILAWLKGHQFVPHLLFAAIFLGGCGTVEKARRSILSDYRPAAVTKKIDAVVAIETSVLAATLEAWRTEAYQQVMAEAFAILFMRPSFKRGESEEFILQASLVLNDYFLRWNGELTATISDPKTGEKLWTYRQGAAGGSSADVFKKLMGPLERDLVKAFDEPAIMVKRRARSPDTTGLLPRPGPGVQPDR